jgi:hypothetical protein
LLLHKRAKPILPPCVHFSNHKSIKTYTLTLLSVRVSYKHWWVFNPSPKKPLTTNALKSMARHVLR